MGLDYERSVELLKYRCTSLSALPPCGIHLEKSLRSRWSLGLPMCLECFLESLRDFTSDLGLVKGDIRLYRSV